MPYQIAFPQSLFADQSFRPLPDFDSVVIRRSVHRVFEQRHLQTVCQLLGVRASEIDTVTCDIPNVFVAQIRNRSRAQQSSPSRSTNRMNLGERTRRVGRTSVQNVSVLASSGRRTSPQAVDSESLRPRVEEEVVSETPKKAYLANPKLQEAYLEICRMGTHRPSYKGLKLSELTQEEQHLEHAVQVAQEEYIEAMRELNACRDRILSAKGQGSPKDLTEERFKNDLETILQNELVSGVNAYSDRLLVRTRDIIIKRSGHQYLIGQFEISIYLSGSVIMVNKTHARRRDGERYDHPHVKDGLPCLGNMKEAIPALIAGCRYPAAVTLCIKFLQSYARTDEYGPFLELNAWNTV